MGKGVEGEVAASPRHGKIGAEFCLSRNVTTGPSIWLITLNFLGANLFSVIGYVSYRRDSRLVWLALTWACVALMLVFNQQLVTVWVALVAVQLSQALDQGMPSLVRLQPKCWYLAESMTDRPDCLHELP